MGGSPAGDIIVSAALLIIRIDCLSEPPELYILQVDSTNGEALGDTLIVSLEDIVTGVCFIDEATRELEMVKEIIPTDQRAELRFNHGGIDAMAAMADGPNQLPESYGTPRGRLWRYDPDGSLHLMITKGVVCGKGLAWIPDNKTMYFNASFAMVVFAFDFGLESGSITKKRLLIDRRSSYGEPDGIVRLIINSMDGNLWIAVFASHRIMAFSPEGKHLKDIICTAKNPACTTWGGKDHNIIFMASGKDHSEHPERGGEGGHMFKYHPVDARGYAKHEFAGSMSAG
ncbi:SMP-30/Gluconolaconase/LRE-like region-domain-containing protein [Aspergillus spectabilis]